LGPLVPCWDSVVGVGRDCRKFSTIMNTKNPTSSAPRQQNKPLCPGSDDSDSDSNTSVFPRWLVIEAADSDTSLSRLSPFALGLALQAQIGTLKAVKRLQRGDILVEIDKHSYSRMLLGLTQLAGVPVKVSPHRSLNTSRGVIRSRDIADCNVEEIVEELQPQGVTAASIIHVRDGDSRRRTNTVVLTFAFPQPPKHITAGYLRVPVEPYIPNPLRWFNCQKYGHSSRACKSTALCVHCGESGHEAAQCKNHQKCINCKGDNSPSSRECPKWKLENGYNK